MSLDPVFRALADPTRRRILDELAERDGQTLFELTARLICWHGASLSRQALSKHLAVLEDAELVRTQMQWRSKHHFLQREPLRRAWRLWLQPFIESGKMEIRDALEDKLDERSGR